MAYKSYLIERFDYSHENIFFREINEKLKSNYERRKGLFIFIGNVSIGGNHLDALFIKNGAIIVIDFKDYEGNLSFSENGPWKLTTEEEKMIFVAGGAKSRNPFQQVNAYRFALFQLLSEKENLILEQNHKVKWDYTSAIVLFQRKIKYNPRSIPAKVARYFHISDIDDYDKLFDDLNTNWLNLTDNEIIKILSVLSVDTTIEYDSSKEIIEHTHELKYTPVQIDRIKKLIPKENDISIDKAMKSLLFYNAMIRLERLNESSVNDIHQYNINWSFVDFSNYKLDITINKKFLDVFAKNQAANFPKNLFISIDMYFDKRKIPLFYTIIMFSEIDNIEFIPINFNNFSLFTQTLAELQLTEDIIHELITSINTCETLGEKINVVRKILEVDIKFADSISLGLSNESLYTAQLQAEFNYWIKRKVIIPPTLSVFRSLLTADMLPKGKISKIDYLQITQLNKSQQKAVKSAFSQYLSVITGPPGTGKSQVVMNILANGVYNNQKVLFASKNNKAVDNVYERINSLLNSDYFIRLGNEQTNAKTVRKINLFKNKINTKKIIYQKSDYSESRRQLNLLMQEIEQINYRLDRMPILENNYTELKSQKEQYEIEYNSWIKSQKELDIEFYINKDLNYNSVLKSDSKRKLLLLKNTKGYFKTLLYNIFYKNNVYRFVKKLNSNLPDELKQFVDSNAPYYSENMSEIDSFILNINFILEEKQKQEQIHKQYNYFTQAIKKCETQINTVVSELNEYKLHIVEYNNRLLEIEKEFINISKKTLLLKINQNLYESNTYVLDSYANYLASGVPWKNEEKKKFHNISKQFLDIFNVISISNLTIKKAFLQEPEIFDLLIIDEASQCDIASVLPLVFRAKRLVVLGDPLQLPHITSINKYEQNYALDKLGLSINEYNYIKYSFFHKAEIISNKNKLDQSFLNEHYRCHPDIIKFSNDNFYLPIAGQGLVIKTKPNDFKFGNTGFNWINVKGIVHPRKNINFQEVEKSVELVIRLRREFPEASIGITTPFKDQKITLVNALSKISNITIDTVYGFQGDEKDIMLFSLVVSPGCKPSLPRFINEYSSYQLNVAVTRAKSALYIIGDKEYCKKLKTNKGRDSFLAKLAQYNNQ